MTLAEDDRPIVIPGSAAVTPLATPGGTRSRGAQCSPLRPHWCKLVAVRCSLAGSRPFDDGVSGRPTLGCALLQLSSLVLAASGFDDRRVLAPSRPFARDLADLVQPHWRRPTAWLWPEIPCRFRLYPPQPIGEKARSQLARSSGISGIGSVRPRAPDSNEASTMAITATPCSPEIGAGCLCRIASRTPA
jgi:hypothetical protein